MRFDSINVIVINRFTLYFTSLGTRPYTDYCSTLHRSIIKLVLLSKTDQLCYLYTEDTVQSINGIIGMFEDPYTIQ